MSAIGTFRAICESGSMFWCIFGLRMELIGDFRVKSAAVPSRLAARSTSPPQVLFRRIAPWPAVLHFSRGVPVSNEARGAFSRNPQDLRVVAFAWPFGPLPQWRHTQPCCSSPHL